MTRIALLPESPIVRGKYIDQKDLPCNYMEDFSLMGFIVSNFKDAMELIRSQGIDVFENKAGAEIVIETPNKLMKIRDLLETHNINCSYSDIADTFYQA